MKKKNNIDTFLELVRAGLWADTSVHDSWFMVHDSEKVNWDEVYQLAEEQSLVGVVLAGIEHSYIKPPQELLLQWIGEVQMLEQQNKTMNQFIGDLIEKMRKADIYTLLVKGQGIAQCYERPLWRCCGDVDLFLSASNYDRAKALFSNLASHIDTERSYNKHLAFEINDWEVELHGSLRCSLWNSVNRILGEIQKEILYNGAVRSWMNGQTQVFIPDANEDVVYVFTHILNHFFRGGIGLRQICDWCRLLWTFKDRLDYGLLESRIRKMGVMTEWKTFATLAVDHLGMPVEAMPFYSDAKSWSHKANEILSYIIETGNFGHNIDVNYQSELPAFSRKIVTLWRSIKTSIRLMCVFPFDSIRSLFSFMFLRLRNSI